jgi:hypothetical protein
VSERSYQNEDVLTDLFIRFCAVQGAQATQLQMALRNGAGLS